MRIRIGDREVLESGTVVGHAGNAFEFVLGDPPTAFVGGPSGPPVRVRFLLSEDRSKPGHRIDPTVPDKTTLQLQLVNFVNPLGIGTNQPIKIGTFQQRVLYVGFSVYAIVGAEGNPPPPAIITFHYSFMLGEVAP